MTQPLAQTRDEVVYLVCTHPRVGFAPGAKGEVLDVLLATGELSGEVRWESSRPWARVRLPPDARPSAVRWMVLDSTVASLEDAPAVDVDPADDPDGEEGRFREELLPWIFDRHLELGQPGAEARGSVEAGLIDFRVEYVGKRTREALRRPAGAHHKVSRILGATLLYHPNRLVYLLPCDLHVAVYESGSPGLIKMHPLGRAPESTGLSRTLLTATAEEALIAWLGPPYNVQNTGRRRFPRSASGERLLQAGIAEVQLNFARLPQRVRIHGSRESIEHGTRR